MSAKSGRQVQVFGRKREAVAVALAKEGRGLIRLNGEGAERFPAAARVCRIAPGRSAHLVKH
jgi:ribosomal protein S9